MGYDIFSFHWIDQEVNSGYFIAAVSVQDILLNMIPLWLEGVLQQVWLGGWSMPSASRTGELNTGNTGTKKCSPAPGLSGQWCEDNLWMSLQGIEFQRWNLACRSREKAPRVRMSNQKN